MFRPAPAQPGEGGSPHETGVLQLCERLYVYLLASEDPPSLDERLRIYSLETLHNAEPPDWSKKAARLRPTKSVVPLAENAIASL